MPNSTIGLREIRGTDPNGDERITTFQRQCRKCIAVGLPIREGTRNELEPPVLDLSAEAKALWNRFAQAAETGCAPGGAWAPVRSAALKMGENVARIAAVLTLFQTPEAANQSRIYDATRTLETTISGETMAAACTVGMFYLQEALRLTGHAILDPETRAQNEMAEWLFEKVQAGNLTAPSIIQKLAPSHLRTDAGTVRRRVEALVGFGRLEPAGRQEIDGKRYRETYRVIGEEV